MDVARDSVRDMVVVVGFAALSDVKLMFKDLNGSERRKLKSFACSQ